MSKEEEGILKEIMEGGNEKTETIIDSISKEHAKKQYLPSSKDKFTDSLVRETFALLLKITGAIPDWVATVEGGDSKCRERLYNLWSSASQVRGAFNMKRNMIPETHSEQEVKNDIEEIVKGLKDKIELLFKFRSAVLEEQEKMLSYERVQLPMQPNTRRLRRLSEADVIKERLAKWKGTQLTGTHNEVNLFSSVIEILKSNITASELIAQLENYYLRAIVLYNVMSLMKYAIHLLPSKDLRSDVLAWIMTIFKRTTTAPWHYSQLTTSCGVAFQSLLRAAFFGVVKQVLEYVSLTKDKKEMRCLMDALKWNYTATDHENLNKCKLFTSLRGNAKSTYIFSLWGGQADDETSSLLLNTFEFIIIKITTRVLGKAESNIEAQDNFPGLEKTTSLIDEGSSTKLFEAIVNILFEEFKRAVESYEIALGMNKRLVEDYIEYNRVGYKDDEKDSKRISKEFVIKSSTIYSQEFCARLLGMLYRLFVAIQNNNAISTIMNSLIQPSDLLYLLKLLKVGSMQHQFLILQTLPFIAKISYDALEIATSRLSKDRITQSNILDFLINFIVEHRKTMWIAELKSPEIMYSITKCAVIVARTLISQQKDLYTGFWKLMNLENDKNKDKYLLETILSIAGGEFLSLYKGSEANIGNKKGYTITCFKNDGKRKEYRYEFNPKVHKNVYLHRIGDKASIRENSLLEAIASEVIPTEKKIDLLEMISEMKEERVREVLLKLLKEPTSEDMVMETIKVKTIRLLRLLLKKNKELSKKIFNSELLAVLLELSLKKLNDTSCKSLLIAEMEVEEMRKVANQTEGQALAIPVMSTPKIKIFKKEIWLILSANSLAISLLASKMMQGISKIVLDYILYSKDMKAEDAKGKVVFLLGDEKRVVKELAGQAKAFIVSVPLEKFNDIKVPIAQIYPEDMRNFNSYKEQLIESHTFFQTNRLDQIITNYGNIKTNKAFEDMNVRSILNSILKNNIEDNKPKSELLASVPKPLHLFTQETKRCDKIFKDNKDISTLKVEMKKCFNTIYYKLYEKSEIVTAEKYKIALNDLKVLNVRHILIDMLINNEEGIKNINIRDLSQFILIEMVEADYHFYGMGLKKLAKKINKILKSFVISNPDFFDYFIKWMRNGVNDMKTNVKKAPNLFTSSLEDILKGVYVGFAYKVFKLLIKFQPKKILTYEDIGDVLIDLLSLVVLVEDHISKYRCILIIKEFLGLAQTLKDELTVHQFNNLIANKAIKALSEYCKASSFSSSLLWKNMKEITLKANAIYRISLSKYGDKALSYCISGDTQLFIGVEVMKSFPEIVKLLTYTWIRMYSAKKKIINELCINSPRPFYDTQYSLLIQDMKAEAIGLNWKIEQATKMIITLDKEMKAPLKIIDRETSGYTEEFNRFYIHYPLKSFEVYGFGHSDNGELGLQTVKNTIEPKAIERINLHKVKAMYAGKSFVILVDKKGNMSIAGSGEGCPLLSTNTFKPYTKHPITHICATNSSSSVLLDPTNDNLHIYGKNPNNMYTTTSTDCSNYILAHNIKDIKQVAVSESFVILLSDDNRLLGSPSSKKEYFGSWVENMERKFCTVKLVDNIIKVKEVLALDECTILLCITSPLNKTELYSFGIDCPSLGQEKRNPNQYARLTYSEELEFSSLAGRRNIAAAITITGEVYIWGDIEKFKLVKKATLTKLDLPKNNKALSVSTHENHMLLLTEDRTTGKRLVLGYGDNKHYQLGVKDQSVNKSVLDFFEDKYPYLILAGSKCSFVACGKKPKKIYHKGCICVNHKKKISGSLYLVTAEECYCQECIYKLPDICLVINNPIKDIKKKEWPDLKKLESREKVEVECTLCKERMNEGIGYHSATKEHPKILCSFCYPKLPPTLIPIIYYRVSSIHTLETKMFPVLSLDKLYEGTTDSLSIMVTPRYKLSLPTNGIDKDFKPSLEDFIEESKTFTKEVDIDIIDLLNDYLTTDKKDIVNLSLKNELDLPFNTKSNLAKYNKEALKRRLNMLIKFNKIINNSLKYIDFETMSSSEYDLYSYYRKVKDYIAIKTKDQIAIDVINNSPSVKGRTECLLNRHKAYLIKSSGGVDHTGEHTLFGQLWRILKEKVNEFRKHFKAEKFPFRVKFKGDGGIDAGGLFRECLDEVCEELQSESLPLLIPTSNNKTGHGDYREKWIVNPSAFQPNHLEMFSFLGSLLGMSFRLSHLLPLNLPSMFWKQLTEDPLDRNDLKAVDAYCVQCLEDIDEIEKKGIDATSFESVIYESFVTRLSDGREEELKKEGREINVTFDNRNEYVQLVEKTRLEEGSKQMEAIKEGLFKVVPQSLIKLYSWRELEIKICGKPTIDIAALKKMTVYSNCSESDIHVKYFWQILTEFTDEERSLYLRFVWGRSRMPSYTENFSHCIYVKSSSNADNSLPESHTCSFQLDWPKYSSLEKAKEKLLYAIRFCRSIDTDENIAVAWDEV